MTESRPWPVFRYVGSAVPNPNAEWVWLRFAELGTRGRFFVEWRGTSELIESHTDWTVWANSKRLICQEQGEDIS